jgi:hypothetical protein
VGERLLREAKVFTFHFSIISNDGQRHTLRLGYGVIIDGEQKFQEKFRDVVGVWCLPLERKRRTQHPIVFCVMAVGGFSVRKPSHHHF